MDGFDELFGEDYLWFWHEALSEERSDREAELVWRLLGLESGMEVLDLACGHGRISNRLAERGARVTGLDRSALFLEHARAGAARRGVEVAYVQGDMRRLPWSGSFDAVLNWFTAFGYHGDEELRGILREVRRVLRPGGRFALETLSLTSVMGRFQPVGVSEREGDLLVERRRHDPLRGGVETSFASIRGGDVRRFAVFIRIPTFTELRDWLLGAGFARVEGYGEDGEPLGHEHQRVVALAFT